MNLSLWTGDFGSEYLKRNMPTKENINKRVRFISWMLYNTACTPETIVEIGAGAGANLAAIRRVVGSRPRLIAVEPNEEARRVIRETVNIAPGDVLDGTAQKIPLHSGAADLVFTNGVLIHIPPSELGAALDEIHRVSNHYIACAEYFSPNIEEVKYRGNDNAMWRADYASMYIDRFDVIPVNCRFFWSRETGLDNITAHVLEKNP